MSSPTYIYDGKGWEYLLGLKRFIMVRIEVFLYLFLAFAQGLWFFVELNDLIEESATNVEISLDRGDSAELLLFFASFLILIYLYLRYRKEKLHMQRLQRHLNTTRRSLDQVNQKLKQTGIAYHEEIKAQFLNWKLTKSEQEVALMLLKGLNFKEIAYCRQTQEKTIRQQATSIYSKTGLKGRHEFAAFFFEDFLLLPESSENRSDEKLHA